jgi:hypothetical protein
LSAVAANFASRFLPPVAASVTPGILAPVPAGIAARVLTTIPADFAAGVFTAVAAYFAALSRTAFLPHLAASFGALALAIIAATFSALMLTSIAATVRPAFPPVPVGADIALVADRGAASLPVLTLSVVPAVRTALAVVNVISGAGIIEVVVPAVISVVVIGVAVISGARHAISAAIAGAARTQQSGCGGKGKCCSFRKSHAGFSCSLEAGLGIGH